MHMLYTVGQYREAKAQRDGLVKLKVANNTPEGKRLAELNTVIELYENQFGLNTQYL